jgi:putative Ca2+/H+ antiporter (TMEM165/GDT1 family)
LGTITNFAIVIAIGEALSAVVPLDAISMAASIGFIAFGLWGLREEKPEEEKMKASRFGVIAAVAITFFIAELGDKTQLATLSLSVQYQDPIGVLVGATLAMLVADGIGIIIGVVFCKRIPRRVFKLVSAALFIAFGLLGIYEILPLYVGLTYTALVLGLLAGISALLAFVILRKQRPQKTPNICKRKAA